MTSCRELLSPIHSEWVGYEPSKKSRMVVSRKIYNNLSSRIPQKLGERCIFHVIWVLVIWKTSVTTLRLEENAEKIGGEYAVLMKLRHFYGKR